MLLPKMRWSQVIRRTYEMNYDPTQGCQSIFWLVDHHKKIQVGFFLSHQITSPVTETSVYPDSSLRPRRRTFHTLKSIQRIEEIRSQRQWYFTPIDTQNVSTICQYAMCTCMSPFHVHASSTPDTYSQSRLKCATHSSVNPLYLLKKTSLYIYITFQSHIYYLSEVSTKKLHLVVLC